MDYIEDLKIPFPEDMDNWDDKDYINSKMEEFEKENKIKERISSKSHNVQSPLKKLESMKAKPVDRQTRNIVSKSNN